MSKQSAEALILLQKLIDINDDTVSINHIDHNNTYELTIWCGKRPDYHSHYVSSTFINVIFAAAKEEGLI
jgi:hypothetical protein